MVSNLSEDLVEQKLAAGELNLKELGFPADCLDLGTLGDDLLLAYPDTGVEV